MPTLSVYRNGTLEWQGPLTDYTLRIGRSPDNDLVLEDPTKGVSRFHAELRWEHDGYVIADLGSQNGTWIAGQRISSAPLAEGTEVALGPYRLVLESGPAQEPKEAPTAPLPLIGVQELAAEPTVDPQQAVTMLPQSPPEVAPPPPRPVTPPQAAAPPPLAPAPPPPPTPRPPAPPAAASSVPQPLATKGTPVVPVAKAGAATPAGRPIVLVVVAVGAIAVLLAVVGVRALLVWRSTSAPSNAATTSIDARSRQVADALALARQAIAAGQFDAARQHLDAALAIDPANREAAELRRQAEATPAVIAPPSESVEGPEVVPETPAPPVTGAAAPPPAPTSDAATGLTRQRGESPKAFARRVADTRKIAADLQDAITEGRVADARNLLTQLTSAAPHHGDIAPLTEGLRALETRERGKSAQAAYEEGKRLQQSGTDADLVGARGAYRKAGSIQAGLGEAELQQIDARLKDLGKVALSNARNFQNSKRREQAIEQYKRALFLLGECAECEKALTDLQQP